MQTLNFPKFDFKTKQSNNSELHIFDEVRKKWLVLTPEEWVRQHVLHLFHYHYQVPFPFMAVEKGITYNRLSKRIDALIYARNMNPMVLVETKAPEVEITQSTFKQAATYNQIIKCPFLFISNGLKHYTCQVHFSTGEIKFLTGLPSPDVLATGNLPSDLA